MSDLSQWNYRRQHSITCSTALDNYCVKIKIRRESGTSSGDTIYVGTGCREDYGDVRFVDSDNSTELSYWLETNAGTYAEFWVKVPSITTTSYIYIYYGNSSATTTSDGAATFPFFEDFASGTLDTTTKWTVERGQAYSITGGVITVTGSNDMMEYIRSQDVFPSNYIVHFYAKFSNTSGASSFGFTVTPTETRAVVSNTSGSRCLTNVSGNETDGSTIDTNWHDVEIIRNGTTSVIFKIDGTTVHTSTTRVPTGDLNVALRQYATGSNQQHDKIYVRQYSATEPTQTPGNEILHQNFESIYDVGKLVDFISAYDVGKFIEFASLYDIDINATFESIYTVLIAADFASLYKLKSNVEFTTGITSNDKRCALFRTRVESVRSKSIIFEVI